MFYLILREEIFAKTFLMCVQEDLQQKEASKSNLQQPIRGQQLLKRSRKPGVIFFSVDPVALSLFFC
jgi:hypothetical protein